MADGSETAFLAQVNAHRAILEKIVRTYCAEEVDREDLRQAILGHLWRSHASFDGQAQFSTWMYRVALNVAISHIRQVRRHDRHLVQPGEGVLEDVPVEVVEPDERLVVIEAFLARLNELDRALLLLYLDDRSYREIADVLGISETNVATKVSRLKQRLRNETTHTTQVTTQR